MESDLTGLLELIESERLALDEMKRQMSPIFGYFSNTCNTSASGSNSKKVKSVNFSIPTTISSTKNSIDQIVSHLSHSEFENLPKYLVGRMNVQKINSFIDELNRILCEKYSLLQRANPAKLSVDQRQRYFEWKSAETEETAGKYFLTETDLKAKSGNAPSGFKYDQVARNIMTILRQVGRIRESRSPGVIRFIVL